MNLYNAIAGDLDAMARTGRIYGVVVGIVTNNEDPDDQGRVKIKYPWLSAGEESPWARIATPLGGKERGMFFLPEVEDEVLVIFEQGDITRPYILGGLWGGTDLPPTADGDGRDKKILKSKSGHIIRLDDTNGEEKIEIIGKDAKDTIVIDVAKNTITLKSDKDLVFEAPKGKVSIKAKEVEVVSTGASTYEASGEMTVKGSQVNIN